MKQIYLNLYSSNKPYLGMIASYDLKRKKWIRGPQDIIMDNDLAKDLAAYGFGECYFLLSRHKDLANATFDRNRNGEISVADRVRKLSLPEGIALATKVRNSSGSQLANLNPNALTNENRYVKRVTVFTDSVLEQAVKHRVDGMALRAVAQKLNVNYESLRKTLRLWGAGMQNRGICH